MKLPFFSSCRHLSYKVLHTVHARNLFGAVTQVSARCCNRDCGALFTFDKQGYWEVEDFQEPPAVYSQA